MKATFNTLEDGTVVIDLVAEDGAEVMLLRCFYAQTYQINKAARVHKYGATVAQFVPEGRPLPKETKVENDGHAEPSP